MTINLAVQAMMIAAYAARLAGVQTSRIATSISLFNLFMTASRLSALLMIFMLGPLSDRAGHLVRAFGAAAVAAPAVLHGFEWQVRLIVFAGTIGTAAGALLLPAFVYLFKRGIRSFERTGSLPHSVVRLADPRVIVEVFRSGRLPSLGEILSFSMRGIPRRLLFFNVVVTGIYAIGVVAAYYASVIDVNAARTAVGLSGIINGIGTIAFTFFVDPTSSIITDQAAKGERPVSEVKSMVFYLALTAIVGTLLSQLILWPSAQLIAFVAAFVNHWH